MMLEIYSRIGRRLDWLNRVLAVIAGTMLVSITVAICWEIVSRSFFDISNNWLVEISEIVLLYTTFLGAAWVLGNDKHVTIDLLVDYLSDTWAQRLQITLSLIGAITCFVLVWFGGIVTLDQFQNEIREPTIMAPQSFWITIVIPFGFLLLGLQFIRRGVRSKLGLPDANPSTR